MAASKNRDARVLVGFKYDASGEKAYAAGLARIDAEQKAVARSANLVNGASSDLGSGFRLLDANTYELVDSTESWADNLDALRRSLEPVEESVEDLRRTWIDAREEIEEPVQPVVNEVSGSRRGIGLQQGIDRFGRVGNQIAGGLGNSNIGGVTDLVGDLVGSIGSLGIAGSVATGAIAGLTVGIQLLNTETRDVEQTFRAAQTAQDIYYDAVRNSTSALVREQIPELQRDIDVWSMQLAEGRAALAANITPAGQLLANVANALGVSAATSLIEYEEQLDQLEQQINTNTQAVGRLKDGLQLGAFAYNDNIESARQYQEVLSGLIVQQSEINEASARYADQLEYDQKQALEANIEASARYADQLEYEAKQRRIVEEEAARSRFLENFTDALDKTRAAQETVSKAQDALTESELKNIQEIQDAERQALEDEQKLTGKYHLDTKRAAEDLADDLKKIRDDAAYDTLVAVGERDAMAAFLARQNADKQEKDAKQAADKEADRRKEDYNTQLSEQRIVGKRRVDLERSQAEAELNTRRAALITAQNDYSKALGNQQLIYRSMYGSILTDTQMFATTFKKLIKDALIATGSSKSGTGSKSFRNAMNEFVDARIVKIERAARGV